MNKLIIGSAAIVLYATPALASEACDRAGSEFGNIVLRKVASKYCAGFKPTDFYESQIREITTVTCPRFKAIFESGERTIETAAGHDVRASTATYCGSTLSNVGP